MLRRLLVCALTFLPVPLVAQVDLRETVTFGDSLTNNDLFGRFRHPLYGRDPMEAVFVKAAGPNARLRNYAVGGARARDVRSQILLYALDHLVGGKPLGTLLSYEAGGNDVLRHVGTLSRFPPGPITDPLTDRILETIVDDLVVLAIHHPGARLVVWTIPDVTTAPLHWRLGAAEKRNLRANLQGINGFLRALEVFPNVVVLDVEAIWRRHAAAPPVVKGRPLLPPPAFGRLDALFADPIHPSAVGNALLANACIERMNRRWGARVPPYSEAELAALAGR